MYDNDLSIKRQGLRSCNHKVMCLYPKFILNKKYLAKKGVKNKPLHVLDDIRKKYVPVGCGNCIECRKQKAQQWRIRLMEELKVHKYAYFVTLTFSNEELAKLCEEKQITECNGLCAIAVRRFLERWRKKYGKSLKHWLITELGHEGTERIHMHGIIFSEEYISSQMLTDIWKYGFTDTGQYCNERSINYIIKYVTKIDNDHKDYKADIFCSAGLGSNYINDYNRIKHKYRPKETIEYYTLSNGQKVNLPIYYRNHFFTPEEREKLWIEKLDQHKRYIRGIECNKLNTDKGYNNYIKILKDQQEDNIKLGYGDTTNKWQEKPYNVTAKMLNYRKFDKK